MAELECTKDVDLPGEWSETMKVPVWGDPVNVDKPHNCPEDDDREGCLVVDGSDAERCPHFRGVRPPADTVDMGTLIPGCCAKMQKRLPVL